MMGAEGWVPVTERMPAKGEDVLVFVQAAGRSRPRLRIVMSWTDYGWWPIPEDRHIDITHWQPLPDDPRSP